MALFQDFLSLSWKGMHHLFLMKVFCLFFLCFLSVHKNRFWKTTAAFGRQDRTLKSMQGCLVEDKILVRVNVCFSLAHEGIFGFLARAGLEISFVVQIDTLVHWLGVHRIYSGCKQLTLLARKILFECYNIGMKYNLIINLTS